MSYIDVFRMLMIDQPDYEIGQPASEDHIEAFERHYNVRLPADMKEYALKINGVYCDYHDFMYFEALNNWRSYGEYIQWRPYMKLDPDLLDSHIWFGSYESYAVEWFAALSLDARTEAPIYAVYNRTPIKIADTFTEFIALFGRPDESFRLGYRPVDL